MTLSHGVMRAREEISDRPSQALSSAVRRPGLYVHVPFCARVCPYCDFAVTRGGRERRAAFVRALLREVALAAPAWRMRAGVEEPFDTIYFGGGTPSLLEAGELAAILGALREHLPVAPEARLFLEANPEDATPERLAALRELGIATLSLGVQSFDPAALRLLGRRHRPDEARRAVERALEAGFPTVSVDLIFGLPAAAQGLGGLRRDLETVAALAPQHVSGYQLTIHEGTPFARGVERGVIRELPDAGQRARYELVLEVLSAAGYAPYEVSNFARAPEDGVDHRSAHNRKYWDHTPYLGLGPSAHSFDGRRRWWNERDLGAWEGRVRAGERPVAGVEALGSGELALEALMLGLRTAGGVDLASFRERFGVDLVERNRKIVEALAADGLVELTEGRLRPTLRGFAVADALPAGFSVS